MVKALCRIRGTLGTGENAAIWGNHSSCNLGAAYINSADHAATCSALGGHSEVACNNRAEKRSRQGATFRFRTMIGAVSCPLDPLLLRNQPACLSLAEIPL